MRFVLIGKTCRLFASWRDVIHNSIRTGRLLGLQTTKPRYLLTWMSDGTMAGRCWLNGTGMVNARKNLRKMWVFSAVRTETSERFAHIVKQRNSCEDDVLADHER